MKRKTSLALLLCLLSGFVLVGCNQSSDNSGTSSTNAAPAAPPSTNK
ncbi:MAG TPA: hypothetical protein VFB72_10150 [Verrucomicrobiae bacterium]|nr:hypothetical protein [Verrucomicrobiae bacterium]